MYRRLCHAMHAVRAGTHISRPGDISANIFTAIFPFQAWPGSLALWLPHCNHHNIFRRNIQFKAVCHQGCEIKEFSWKRCVCSCLVGCLPTHLLTASICRRLLQALHTVPDKIHITHTCTHHSYNILKYTFIWTRLRGNDLTWHLFVVHS